MRKIVFIAVAILNQYIVSGQVAKNVIVEHFTNTYCSVCASRNPGFYGNRVKFPQVIHIAYHPSAPYASCPLNRHNKAENDERTKYYGVFGSTPRLVIQGKPLSAGADYDDGAIFSSELGQTTAFTVEAQISPSGSSDMSVSVKIKKVSASTLSSLELYAALAEDTLFFKAANGEAEHYDVFRKSVWGAPMSITAPATVGDSVVYTKIVALNTEWAARRMYAIAMLQDAGKEIVQVARSANLESTTGIPSANPAKQAAVYPNPTRGSVSIDVKEPATILLYNLQGRLIQRMEQSVPSAIYNLATLPSGIYHIEIVEGKGKRYQSIVKE